MDQVRPMAHRIVALKLAGCNYAEIEDLVGCSREYVRSAWLRHANPEKHVHAYREAARQRDKIRREKRKAANATPLVRKRTTPRKEAVGSSPRDGASRQD